MNNDVNLYAVCVFLQCFLTVQLVSSIIPSSILMQYTQGHSAGFTAKTNVDTKQDAHNAVVSNFLI